MENKLQINNILTAIYVRISEEDESNNLSKSIKNQIDILTSFAKENHFIIYKIYIDDGYSGKDFNRPKFNEMMMDINKKLINCIVVKDLSRMGRNLIEVGKYLDDYLPKKNIRFIAVNDNYDSAKTEDDSYLLRCFMNDRYLKDCRKKAIKTYEFLANKKDIFTEAIYGYKNDGTNHLIIDEEASLIIKKIYKLYLEGNGTYKIANILTNEKNLIPTAYKIKKGYRKKDKYPSLPYKWDKSTINRILRNEEYTGVAINLNKSHRENVKIIKLDNAHPSIIDKETYLKVQTLLNSKKKIKVNNDLDKIRLKGMITINNKTVCYRSTPSKYDYFLYSTNTKPHISLKSNFVHNIIFEEIKNLINAYKINENELIKLLQNDKLFVLYEKNEELEKKIINIEYKLKELFEKYALELIALNQYKQLSNDLSIESQKLQSELNDVKFQIDQLKFNKKDLNKYINHIKSLSTSKLDLNIVRLLISKVEFKITDNDYTVNFIYKINH